MLTTGWRHDVRGHRGPDPGRSRCRSALWVLRDSPESIGLTARRRAARCPATPAASVERVSAGDGAPDARLLAARGVLLHLRLLDEPALRARASRCSPTTATPRCSPRGPSACSGGSSIVFTVMLGALVRPLRAPSGARRDLRGPHRRSSPGFFLIRDNPTALIAGRGPGRHHPGRHRLDDLRAHRRHLRPLLGQLRCFGADLPRAPDRLRARLLAGRARCSRRPAATARPSRWPACSWRSPSVVALKIDKDARRIWRAATASASS